MSNKCDFIAELTEARMFRRLQQVKGETVDEMARRLFNHLLVLRMLFTLDKPAAVDYIKDTMSFTAFKDFRTSSTDLYNQIVLVLRQYDYANVLFNDWEIVLPELRIRRVLRAMSHGTLDESDFNELLLVIQRRATLTGYQIALRRAVSDFDKHKKDNQRQIFKRLLLLMREDSIQSDLYMLARQVGSKVGSL